MAVLLAEDLFEGSHIRGELTGPGDEPHQFSADRQEILLRPAIQVFEIRNHPFQQ